MAQVAPVGTTKDLQKLEAGHGQMKSWVSPYHVQIHDSNAETEVVLVEHSLKRAVQKLGAGEESYASPWIKRATLEL
jgi:hypothetical protein